MKRLILLLALGAALTIAPGLWGDDPRPVGLGDVQGAPAVGKWKVEFANGVVQESHIRRDGDASVEEPRRRSNGTAQAQGGALVITFDDDRVERWTPVGTRFVVEHWFPGLRLPTTTAVLGIAERAK
jgi:hypothetical protein